MTLIPMGASVTHFKSKLAQLSAKDVSNDWYNHASRTLRGGDGGEHGLVLYKLVLSLSNCGHPLVLLDVGTARGFSAITMARAMLDAGLEGRVYSIDIIDHYESRNWHVSKHKADEPLAGVQMTRSRIWDQWYEDEASRVAAITGNSHDVLNHWNYGEIDLAFLDGSHTYDSVKKELSLLDSLMSPGGTIVLDDYHLGISIARVRSRPVNVIAYAAGKILGRVWPWVGSLSPRLGINNEFVIMKRSFYGIRKAVHDFLEEREGRWSLEILSMPSRGDYQGDDYSLALLARSA